MPVIATFLAAAVLMQGAIPDAPAKATIVKICTGCHTLDVVISKRRTNADWRKSVEDMAGRGMKATDEEMEATIAYFTRYFGKVNVNHAEAEDIASILDLTAKEAAAIVKYRQENGDFKSLDALAKVPGLDAAKVETRRDRILLR